MFLAAVLSSHQRMGEALRVAQCHPQMGVSVFLLPKVGLRAEVVFWVANGTCLWTLGRYLGLRTVGL